MRPHCDSIFPLLDGVLRGSQGRLMFSGHPKERSVEQDVEGPSTLGLASPSVKGCR